MYISRNLYDKTAQFVNLTDQEFFKTALTTATSNFYAHQEQFEDDSILEKFEQVKHNATPVFYGSTVTKKSDADQTMTRVAMNGRLRRKFIVLDMDFDANTAEASEWLYQWLIRFSNERKCQLVIYPTASYPTKPRFRAILFTGLQLNEKTYWAAAHWIYNEIKYSWSKAAKQDPAHSLKNQQMSVVVLKYFDKGFDRITSNNNLPIFTNEEQINKIYSNLDDDQYKPLHPKADEMWRDKVYTKQANKIFKRSVNVDKSKQQSIDELKLDHDKLIDAAEKYSHTSEAQDYDVFWKFVYSIARSVYVGQIGSGTAEVILRTVANGAPDPATKSKWQIGNLELFHTSLKRLESGKTSLDVIKPLTTYLFFNETSVEQEAKLTDLSTLLNQPTSNMTDNTGGD